MTVSNMTITPCPIMGRLDQEEVQYNEKIRNYVHRSSKLRRRRTQSSNYKLPKHVY